MIPIIATPNKRTKPRYLASHGVIFVMRSMRGPCLRALWRVIIVALHQLGLESESAVDG